MGGLGGTMSGIEITSSNDYSIHSSSSCEIRKASRAARAILSQEHEPDRGLQVLVHFRPSRHAKNRAGVEDCASSPWG